MRSIALAAAVLFAAGLAAALPPSSEAAAPIFPASWSPDWSPNGKQIVFTTDRRGSLDLWVMRSDGKNQRPLTTRRGDEWSPAWSPDGTKVAFVSDWNDPDEVAHVYVVGADGTGARQLTSGRVWDSHPQWSPDGTKLVFARLGASDDDSEDAGCQLFVVNADGTGVHQILADGDDDEMPAWSPDGTRIAFTGGDEEGYIDVVGVDGTGRVRLTDGGREYDPAWSADGRQLAFYSYRGDYPALWAMNADGTNQRQLFLPRRGARSPEWSPDGRRIAFVGYATDDSQVYVVDSSGAHVARLTGRALVRASDGSRCTIFGGTRADVLRGTPRTDVICGLGGNDTIIGAGSRDTLDGGPGNDLIVGGSGADSIFGGAGRDVIRAVDGARDWIDGGAGRDTAYTDPGDWASFVEIRN